MSLELMSPDMDGKVQAGKARFTLNLKALGDAAAKYKWAGAPVAIYSAADLAWPAVTELDGYVTDRTLDLENGTLQISCEVATDFLEGNLLTGQFSGGGGINGDGDKRGTLYPAGFGSCENIPPVWFDNTRWIGMIDGYGNTVSINRLMEGLNDFGPRVADYATYAALAAAIDAETVKPGQWATCVAQGLVGLGAPPEGPITVNAVFGSNRVGAIMRRVLEVHRGVPVGSIDTAAFTSLDAAVPRNVHYWTDGQRDVKDLLEALAGSANATPIVSFQKKVTVTRAVPSGSIATLDRSGKQEPRVVDWKSAPAVDVYWRLKARTARPASVLTYDQVNYKDTIEDKGLYSPTETYRAGMVVWLADKSSWIYTSDTPGSGNAPPAWPTTSNAYWENLTPPATAADIRYSNGATIDSLRPLEANATEGATIGLNVDDTAGNPVRADNVRNNMALLDWWKKGASIPWTLNGEDNFIYSSAVDMSGNPPPPAKGEEDLWFCVESTGDGNASGGWDFAPIAPLNPDKAYRFVIPIFRRNGTASAYWGCNGVCDLNTTTPASNPYFAYSSTLQGGRWYLLVGFIYPRNSSGKGHDTAGIWDCQTGLKVDAGTNYCFRPDGTQPTHRAYQYYGSAGAQQVFGRPRIEPTDSLSDLRVYFEDGATLNNGIGVDSNGNFINPVGSGSGTNVSNTLVANKLTNIGSSPVTIEGNSIRRQAGNNDYNACVRGEPVTGACFAEIIVPASGYAMLSLDTEPTGTLWSDQRITVHSLEGGTYTAYIDGVAAFSGPAASSGQVMRLAYDGSRYQLFINGVQVGVDVATFPGRTHYAKFHNYSGPNIRISGLNYGPYSINSAETKFIVQTTSGPALRLIGGNAILRDGSGGWDSQCYSERGIVGGCFAEVTITDSSCYFMMGLNEDPTADAGYSSIDYAVYSNTDGNIYCYESGTGLGLLGALTPGTTCRVMYDDNFIRYFINGEEVRSIRTASGRKFHFDSSIVQGAALTNLRFGPVTPDAAGVDFLHDGNLQSQRGNTVFKRVNAPGTGWDTKSVSRQVQVGTAYVSGKLATVNTFLGLKRPADGGTSYTSMKASFQRSSDGNWYTWSYSGSRVTLGASYGGVTFSDNTEFRITYDGVMFRWYADNVLMDSVAEASGLSYAACVALYAAGCRVENIQFGPYTDNAWASTGGTGKPEDNADVTSYITGSTIITIECDNNGTPISALLPKTTQFKLMKNGVDETTNATWSSSTVLSGTVTQSTNVAGVNSVTAMSSSTAKVRVTATLGSAVRWMDVDIVKRLAPAETGGSGSGGTSATVPVNATINVDGMQTVSNELIFNTGSAGTATLTGNVAFSVPETGGNRNVLAFWIWQRWNGSAWVDEGTEVESDPDCNVSRYFDAEFADWVYTIAPGILSVGKVVTGLTANAQVKFRLRARRVTGPGELVSLYTTSNIGGTGT